MRILETVLYAADLEAAESFYAHVFQLPLVEKSPGRHLFFRLERSMLLIFDPQASAEESDSESLTSLRIPQHGAVGSGHLAFAVSAEQIAHWKRVLDEHGIPLEREIFWPHGAQSLYLRDPAGNSLELATPQLWGWDDLWNRTVT